VSAGHEDIVRELVGAGANVKATNDKGITPLHYAASKGRVDVGISTLLQVSPTETHIYRQVGKLLIERGADVCVCHCKITYQMMSKAPCSRQINAKDRANQHPLYALES